MRHRQPANRWLVRISCLATCGFLLTAPWGVGHAAQDFPDCAQIEDTDERLECYRTAGRDNIEDWDDAEPVHAFSGTDDWNSEIFEMERSWRVRWQKAELGYSTIELRAPEGDLISVAGFQVGEGRGRSDILEPGIYRLGVRGMGEVRLEIVEEE